MENCIVNLSNEQLYPATPELEENHSPRQINPIITEPEQNLPSDAYYSRQPQSLAYARVYHNPTDNVTQVPQYTEENLAAVKVNNSPQFLSVGSAAFVIFTGGMSIFWTRGEFINPYMSIAWLVMATLGSLLSAVFSGALSKKLLMLISSLLVIIAGILFISLPANYDAIMAARHLNGFAVGWILITTWIMAGEEAIKDIRGTLISSIQAVAFIFGNFIQLIINQTAGLDINQIHGTLMLIAGLIAFAVILLKVIESPVYYLRKDQELMAVNSLMRLQKPTLMTADKYTQLEEHKQYIAASLSHGKAATLWTLLKLSILRGIIGLSLSSLVVVALQLAVLRITVYELQLKIDILTDIDERFLQDQLWGIDYPNWPFYVCIACRLVGTICGTILQDSVGRKQTLVLGMLFCAGMAIGVAIIFDINIWDYLYGYYTTCMHVAMFLIFIQQLSTGFCMTSSTSYMTEAFPVAIKPYCIAFVFAIEMAMHIVISNIRIRFSLMAEFFYALGALSLGYSIFAMRFLPETKGLSLREALRKF